MRERYINPFTDFGFKKIFGEEANTDLLIDFINTLLPHAGPIASLTFLKNEHLGATPTDRKAIFDLYCENERGEKFIVELQKAKQKYFKDRSLYYTTFAIQEQAILGEWDFRLQKIYAIAIMDFVFDETAANRDKLRHDVQLVETASQTVFYDKLHFIYLEMPKFRKTEAQLVTHYDKWLYLLKNLASLEELPVRLQEQIFAKMCRVAELAQYTEEDRRAYQDSVKYYRDIKNSIDTALEEGEARGEAKGLAQGLAEGEAKGRTEGRQEEKRALARQLQQKGFAVTDIAELTGLSEQEVAILQEGSL